MKRLLRTGVSAIALAVMPMLACAEGMTLHVFGPSGESVLGGRLAPEVREPILKQIFDGFIAENPEVSAVDWDYEGKQDTALQRLMTARLAGEPMDILFCTGTLTNGNYVNAGIVKPITGLVSPFKDRFVPAALDDFTVNGELYAVPLSDMSSSLMYYNVDLFKKLGIEPPKTYEELLAIVPVIQAAGVQPLIHQGANAVMWPMWYFETFYQASDDPIGKTMSNLTGATKFTDAADVEAFRMLAKFVDDGVLSRDSLSVDRDGMRSAFATGKSAMYMGGTWEIPPLMRNVTEFQWGIFPFPAMPGAAGPVRNGGGADRALCLPAGIAPDREAMAVKFLEYVSRPEIATLYLTPELPINASIIGVKGMESPIADEMRKVIYPSNIKFLDWIWPTAVTRAVASAAAGVVAGQLTPEAAAQSVQDAFDQLVAAGEWPPKR